MRADFLRIYFISIFTGVDFLFRNLLIYLYDYLHWDIFGLVWGLAFFSGLPQGVLYILSIYLYIYITIYLYHYIPIYLYTYIIIQRYNSPILNLTFVLDQFTLKKNISFLCLGTVPTFDIFDINIFSKRSFI